MSKGKRRGRNVFIIVALALGIIGGYFVLQSFQGGFDPFDPSNYPPSGVNQPTDSATVYQAFYLTFANGKSKWVYAPSRMTSLGVFGADSGVLSSNLLKKIQTHLYMCVNYDDAKTVKSWTFSATGNFKIADANLNVLRNFGDMPISVTGSSLQDNVDVWVTSASMSGSDVQQLYSFVQQTSAADPKIYSLVSSIKNIQITIQYTDGTGKIINVLSGSDNDLVWRFFIIGD